MAKFKAEAMELMGADLIEGMKQVLARQNRTGAGLAEPIVKAIRKRVKM